MEAWKDRFERLVKVSKAVTNGLLLSRSFLPVFDYALKVGLDCLFYNAEYCLPQKQRSDKKVFDSNMQRYFSSRAEIHNH